METLPLFASLVFGALLGSWHCAAMCGPIACALGQKKGSSLWSYHFGRLVSYLSLGAMAGAVGQVLAPLPFALRLPIFLGLCLLISLQILPSRLSKKIKSHLPKLSPRLFRKLPPSNFWMGLLSAALPCGYLWTYVAAAAATTSVFAGAAVLLILWLGSLPALSLMGLYFRQGLQRDFRQAGFWGWMRGPGINWGLALAAYYSLFSHFFLH